LNKLTLVGKYYSKANLRTTPVIATYSIRIGPAFKRDVFCCPLQLTKSLSSRSVIGLFFSSYEDSECFSAAIPCIVCPSVIYALGFSSPEPTGSQIYSGVDRRSRIRRL